MTDLPETIPVITCFDVEPDPRLTRIGEQRAWIGYEKMHQFLSKIRPHLEKFTTRPVHYGWYFRLDPQIADTYGSAGWPLKKYAGYVSEALKQGDEVGVHPHTYKWSSRENDWITIHDDMEYCNACIEMSFQTYYEALGKKCESARMGDKWISSEAIDCMESLGAKYDLTLEPGHESRPHVVRNEKFRGELPSFSGVPHYPYRPWRLDFRIPEKKREGGIWMIPLTSHKIRGFRGAVHRFSRKVLRGKWHEQDYLTLNFDMKPWIFKRLIKQQIKKADLPYLAIVSRVSIAAEKETYNRMCANFKYLVTSSYAKRLRFSTPKEAMEIMGYEKSQPSLNRMTA